MFDTYDNLENKNINDFKRVKTEIEIEMKMEIEMKNKLNIQKKIEKCKQFTSQPHCNAHIICDWNGIKNECNITPDCKKLTYIECNLQKNKCSWENSSNLCRIKYE